MIFEEKNIKDLVLNFEFSSLEKLFKDETEIMPNKSSLNLGIIAFIRALISKSETDFNLAMIKLEDSKKLSEASFNKATLQLYPQSDKSTVKSLQISDDSRFINYQENGSFSKIYGERLFSELVMSESTLLKIFLKCWFTGEHSNILLTLLSNDLISFHDAFMNIYHAHEKYKLFERDHFINSDKFSEYGDGLRLCWGLGSLLLLLLPSQLAIITGTSEFKLSTVSKCLEMIESVMVSEKSLQSILANLIIFHYSCEIDSNLERAERFLGILDEPQSIMSQFFQSKLHHLQGNIPGTIKILAKIPLNSEVIQLPVYWEMIKCFAESQKWPEALQYIKPLKHNSARISSRLFPLYLEASFLHASSGQTNGPPSIEVLSILSQILDSGNAKQKLKYSWLDRLAIVRTRNVIERKESFFLPHFEILLLWDRLKFIEHRDFVITQVRMILESKAKLTFEQQTLGWLILSILSESNESSIKLINNHVLPCEPTFESPNFLMIRAKCELADRLLKEKKGENAQCILDEIEGKCIGKNGYAGQGTILFILSKLKNKRNYC